MKQLLFIIRDRESMQRALTEIKATSTFHFSSSVLLHCFCGNLHSAPDWDCDSFAAQLISCIDALLPEAQLIGLSSGGEFCRGELAEPCILLSAVLFHSASVQVLSFPELIGNEKDAGKRLRQAVEQNADVQGVELLFAGRGINSVPIYEQLRQCRAGLPFFGGYAAAHDAQREPPFLLTKEGILRGATAAVLYIGRGLHIEAGRDTGWSPLGSTFRVTKAKDRRLYAVNGVPAYDLYDRFLHFPADESFRDYAMEFPLMLRRGKMKLLRHPQEKYDDASILLDGRVEEGDAICLSYGAPLPIIRRINARCEKLRAFEPETMLLYSCQGRKRYWGDLIGWETEPFQKLAESGGACLDGQIMRNNQTGRVIEHRLTLLSIAMREGEKTGRSIPKIAVDDDILKGRMSIMHRMSTLIESMVAELQKNNEALLQMNERLARANDELHRIAVTDELTGLYNRREIERRIKEALARAEDGRSRIALVMLDIDFFKKINDTYGHDVGDLVLKEVSAILRASADEARGEAAGRWGGEEFFLLLPEKELSDALALAETIRRTVERHEFPVARHLTVSVGVTSASADSDYQAIFIRADQALYEAKTDGRNRVAAAPDNG